MNTKAMLILLQLIQLTLHYWPVEEVRVHVICNTRPLVPRFPDDRSCMVWDLELGKRRSVLQLKSSCVEVAWHPEDPMKVSHNLMSKS